MVYLFMIIQAHGLKHVFPCLEEDDCTIRALRMFYETNVDKLTQLLLQFLQVSLLSGLQGTFHYGHHLSSTSMQWLKWEHFWQSLHAKA